MTYYRSARRSPQQSLRPFSVFLLVASFGILFAGCGGKDEPAEIPQADEFTFTAEDLARMKELVGNGSGAFVPRLELQPETEGESGPPVLDIGTISKFNAIRTGAETGEDRYRITNAFLNVRANPRVNAGHLGRLERGESVEVVEFVNAGWAKVMYENQEGYVASRYISKIVSEQQLAYEKKKYEGLYFVDFAFLNVRKEAASESEKLGELSSQSFVRPLSMDDTWARIPYGEGDGYIAVQYLTSFFPRFLVRQSEFRLPVVHYRLVNEGVLDVMPQHISALKTEGYTLWTMRDFYQLLLQQEDKDVRLNPNILIVAVSDISPENITEVSDVLRASNAEATLFLESRHLGGGGIDERRIMTLLANGHDIQSAGHTGDDLRSLTNAQVELELSQSKKLIEDITKKNVFSVAFPLGGVNDRVARKAADVGYLLGLSLSPDSTFERTQFLRMPSFVMKASTTVEDLLSLLSR
jgi:uncharacterized protein YgiM (DUF1202 family)